MTEVNKIEDEQEIYYYVLDFVKQNIDSPLSTYALYRYKWAFPLEDLDKICEMIPQDMQSAYKDLIIEYMEGLKRTQPQIPNTTAPFSLASWMAAKVSAVSPDCDTAITTS